MPELIDKFSTPCASTLLDLFKVPPTQVSVDASYYQPIHLTNSCKSDGPWNFLIQPGPHYFHMNKNFLLVTLKITKADGTAPKDVDSDPVGPINMIAKTLFRQVKVTVNGRVAFDSGPNYAYRAYLETELNFDKQVKTSYLDSQLYHKDTPSDKIDSPDNEGLKKRLEPFRNGAEVQVMAPVICDLFSCDRLLLANTLVGLELHKNSNEFCLMSYKSERFKLSVVDMVWYVKKLEISPSVHLGIEATLHRNTAKYPIRRIEVTKLTISPKRQSVPTTPIFNGQIPRRLIVGFVPTDAYFGDYRKSPFVFGNHGLQEISIEAAGQLYPRDPLRLDYAGRKFIRAFVQLYDCLGLDDSNQTNGITAQDFVNSHCLYAFDFSPEEPDSAHWQLLKTGATIIRATFAKAVPEPGLECICFAEFDNLIMIDRLRNIHSDYSV